MLLKFKTNTKVTITATMGGGGDFMVKDAKNENIEKSKKSSKIKTKIIVNRESKKLILHPFSNFGSHLAGFRMWHISVSGVTLIKKQKIHTL
jgi:hypothetical protein